MKNVSSLGRAAKAGFLTLSLFANACIAQSGSESSVEQTEQTHEALSGWSFGSWGTTRDWFGLDLGASKSSTCVLSGVAGDLNEGSEWNSGDGPLSVAEVRGHFPDDGHQWLIARGAGFLDQVNAQRWYNNEVNARATCFFDGTIAPDVQFGQPREWVTQGAPTMPVRIGDHGTPGLRQCFLTGIRGASGSFSPPNAMARVVEVWGTTNRYPVPGWYVEANLASGDESHVKVTAECIDFPPGDLVATGEVHGNGAPLTITGGKGVNGKGIKGCGLTRIQGAFTNNDWNDGAMITPPAKVDGDWSITVSAGKSAGWACAY